MAGIGTGIAQEALATAGSAVVSNHSGKAVVVAAVRDWSPQALDALLGIVQDASADAKVRRKAAFKIAELLLPKVGKKAKALPDEYGFSINPNLASAYRDIQLEVRALANGPTRNIPAVAEKIRKLVKHSDAIRQQLQVPCPTKYGNKEAVDDYCRLEAFTRLRDNEAPLTETQKAEEAHRRVRFDVFAHSPEQVARRRLKVLEGAERRFKMNRLTGDFHVVPLSRKDRSALELFRRLYSKSSRSIFRRDGGEIETARKRYDEFEMSSYHPFKDEWRSSNGNFYPPHSKVRPVGVRTWDWSGPDRPANPPFSAWDAPANDPIESAEP
ncbi:MAG: hypothetical protein WCA56_07095 [Xanthobacteraceae bacterium]